MNLILALLALGGIGFVLLRKEPAETVVEAALSDPELAETLDTAASNLTIREAAPLAARDAILRGDVLGAFIFGITSLTAFGAREQSRHAWIDSVVAVWDELPDSWFLERTAEEAGMEVSEFLPRSGTLVNMTELQWWEQFFTITSFADSYYNRLRDGYHNRLGRVNIVGVIAPAELNPIEKIARLQETIRQLKRDGMGKSGQIPLLEAQIATLREVI